MNSKNWRVIIGGLLVLVGVMSFLNIIINFPFWGILWGFVFASAGAGFLVYSFQNKIAWWAIIPGIILLSLSLLIFSDTIFPYWADKAGGIIFLGGVSLAFWLVYFRNKNLWWAIIPGGVFSSLALVAFVEEFTRLDGGFVFLFGLALTFALLTILPGLPGNRSWPWIPAGILFLISTFTLFSNLNMMNYVLSIMLIAVGAVLIIRTFLKK
ncbi:MAG: hypothetical protein ACYDH1_01805 [Anaerolineaceae bacterium]|jgi:hypothetical protein|nr:MAG: hypothetical protein CVU46_01855 [Chloroflexi bacterium HGW-Chloroflexi-8]